jgi:hypothetical protein
VVDSKESHREAGREQAMSKTPRKYNVSADDSNFDTDAFIEFMAAQHLPVNPPEFADRRDWQPDWRRVAAAIKSLKSKRRKQ